MCAFPAAHMHAPAGSSGTATYTPRARPRAAGSASCLLRWLRRVPCERASVCACSRRRASYPRPRTQKVFLAGGLVSCAGQSGQASGSDRGGSRPYVSGVPDTDSWRGQRPRGFGPSEQDMTWGRDSSQHVCVFFVCIRFSLFTFRVWPRMKPRSVTSAVSHPWLEAAIREIAGVVHFLIFFSS